MIALCIVLTLLFATGQFVLGLRLWEDAWAATFVTVFLTVAAFCVGWFSSFLLGSIRVYVYLMVGFIVTILIALLVEEIGRHF